MRYISIILILLFIGCKTEEQLSSIQVESNVDTTLARIGDVINFNVITHFSDGKNLFFPDIQENESMEVRTKSILMKNNEPQSVNFEIVFWDTGKFVIPEYPVQIINTDSTVDFSIKTDSISVTVISMLDGAEDTNLRPIKDPVPIKEPINWYRWLLAILLVFLIMILIGLWKRRIKNAPLEKIVVSENQSAKDIANVRLDELQKLIRIDCKTFYLHLSFLIREFIENQYYIRALEMTTNEIRQYDNELDLEKDQLKDIINILNRSDLAKFAKYNFEISERESDYKWIKNFIISLKD